MVVGFIRLLKLVTTDSYSAIANSQTLLLTTAYIKSSMSSLVVAWQRIPTLSSASVLTSLSAGYQLTTDPQLTTHWLRLTLTRLAASLTSAQPA
jgi:hypothetical protein